MNIDDRWQIRRSTK